MTTKSKFVKVQSVNGSPIPRKIKIIDESYHLVFNCQHLLVELSPEARSFFDYLCEKMRSDNNSILINKSLKEAFIEHISRITSKKHVPAMNSLNQYVSLLKKLNLLLLPVGGQRAYYHINPKYVYKGTKKQREELLKKLIEEKEEAGQSLKGLLNVPDEMLKHP
jgi:hypothetical protein